MLRFLIASVLLLIFAQSRGQNNLAGYQYWFDGDFSNSITTSISPDLQLDINTAVNTSGLQAGVHSFNFRSWNTDGQYSSVLSSFFYKIPQQTSGIPTDLIAYEYWFDAAYAEAVTGNIAPEQNFEIATSIDAEDLGPGVHNFNIRFLGSSGKWSSVLSSFFYRLPDQSAPVEKKIVAYQYWFDGAHDEAVSEEVSPVQNFEFSSAMDASELPAGLHSFNIRFRENTGLWSSSLSSFFYKIPESEAIIDNKIFAYRYWVDNAFANAVEVELSTPLDPLNLITDLDLTQIPKGNHSIHFQFRDSAQVWSAVVSDEFEKLALPIADFEFSLVSNCDSAVVSFTDLSIDADLYAWNFDDGSTSQEANPSHVYYTSGTYNVSLTVTDTASGLDSTLTMALEIWLYTASTISEMACFEYASPSGNYLWTNSGTYLDTIPSVSGCDSLITIELEILTVDTSVTLGVGELTSNAGMASYQWLDCAEDWMPIPGEINQVFTPAVSGSYAVEVNQNGCVDTSACYVITISSVSEALQIGELKAYPNPTRDQITLVLNDFDGVVYIEQRNLWGQLIQSGTLRPAGEVMVEVEGAPGTYIFEVRDERGKRAMVRVVKL
jgi:PKD repeat protein